MSDRLVSLLVAHDRIPPQPTDVFGIHAGGTRSIVAIPNASGARALVRSTLSPQSRHPFSKALRDLQPAVAPGRDVVTMPSARPDPLPTPSPTAGRKRCGARRPALTPSPSTTASRRARRRASPDVMLILPDAKKKILASRIDRDQRRPARILQPARAKSTNRAAEDALEFPHVLEAKAEAE